MSGKKTTAMCPFCGQGVMIEAPMDATYEETIELAREECSCTNAIEFRKRRKRIEDGFAYIDNLFSAELDDGDTICCFRGVISAVVDHHIESGVIKKGKSSYNIDLDGDGYLRIKKTYKDVLEENF